MGFAGSRSRPPRERRGGKARRKRGWLAATFVLLLPFLSVGATPQTADAAGAPDVIIDTDVSFDDTAAMAYLAEAHRKGLIHLKGVTVSLSGVAYTGTGLSHTRCLFNKLGLGQIPSTDGDHVGLHNLSDSDRQTSNSVVEQAVQPDPNTPCPSVPTEGHAADFLVSQLLAAPHPVRLVCLGPLTNLAEALQSHPEIASKIESLFIMGGSTVGGNLSGGAEVGFDNTQEVNMWADAPSAQAVFTALSGKISLTPLNATNYVPLTQAFRERLANDRTTAAANVVYTIASLGATGEAEQGAFLYWWDPLDAVAATRTGVETFQDTTLHVVQSGPGEGRTEYAPDGAAIHFGTSADADQFHNTFIDMLNDRIG